MSEFAAGEKPESSEAVRRMLVPCAQTTSAPTLVTNMCCFVGNDPAVYFASMLHLRRPLVTGIAVCQIQTTQILTCGTVLGGRPIHEYVCLVENLNAFCRDACENTLLLWLLLVCLCRECSIFFQPFHDITPTSTILKATSILNCNSPSGHLCPSSGYRYKLDEPPVFVRVLIHCS